ncbi:sensor histidine kinase [Longitalea luteola]|uniref:sensor histidine kinase n=1 Tax=Longitalea luteola TaxID=2812563 RepID=UPI001A9617E9|nr:sensor histidine kinase [Longitalea luteola]
MRNLIVLAFLFCLPGWAFGQEYSYTHYDTKEGLAGSTVFCMAQDKDGFIWFGTETGLSRFDGTHFKNFTREDGLPDNDIIQLFPDSKGRVWLSPFQKSVCYYYKGKFYNSENDSLLKKIQIQENILRFAEDPDGNVLLQEMSRLHLVKTNGEVITIVKNGDKPLGYLTLISGRPAGGFWVMLDDKFYILKDGRLTLWKTVEYQVKHYNYAAGRGALLLWRNAPEELSVISTPEHKKTKFHLLTGNDQYMNVSAVDNQNIAACTLDGAWVWSVNNPDSVQHYLPDIGVLNMLKDSEGNWWFSTLGKGVYRLNSAVTLNLDFSSKDRQNFLVLSILKYKDWILAGSTLNSIYRFKLHGDKMENQKVFKHASPNSRMIVTTTGDNTVIIGSKNYLAKLSPDLTHLTSLLRDVSVKDFCLHRNTLLVASEKCVLSIDQQTLKVMDTLWHSRATCVYSDNDTIYLGTQNGLYRLDPDKKAHYMGSLLKEFQGRIAAVREDVNHVLWVATSGDGLIAWKDGKLIKRISSSSGLTSSICRTLFLDKGNLWVGTNMGLNKVNVLWPGFPIEKFTTNDGLLSDVINTVFVYNNKVFVGSPGGISFFDEEKMLRQSRCDLRFTGITIEGETFDASNAPAVIPHEKNNIRFNFVGISYKSNGDIRYRYRLVGLDSAWHETRETFLNYPTLPSGDYMLQLEAINKFDVHSKILAIRFTIDKLWYEEIWFKLLMGALFLAITGLIVVLIVRRVRKREQEKTATNKRINELEQLSRKAQMNPHFIFNSLNSIQHYVMDADVAGANKFISGFSRLIRQTLDFSSRPEISLEEELDYLTNYLELEKTRLEDAFSYKVVIADAVDPADHYIPPMILQPFVENSVRHGLRFRRDKNGMVTITVKRDKDHLVCILEDNGVGRKAAMQYKSISPINYQSKGLSLTADRIDMFNLEHEQKITMHIDDLEDEFHNSLGTRVTISFPVN